MKQSPARVLLILLFVFLGCFGVAYAAAGMLTALPQPAIGGTCGPSTGSETALEALAEPGSIGAGPQPPVSNVTAHRQWQTFISQCQSLADHRGLASLAVLVISLVVAGTGLFWLLRKHDDGEASDADSALGGQAGPPSGAEDPMALVHAGAVIGGSAPVAAWPPAPPQAYGPPSAYPGQPPVPPYPGAGYGHGGYPQQAWPGQAPPPGYAPPPPPTYTPPPPPQPTYTPPPPPPGYPQAPAYPPPPPPPPPAAAPPAPEASIPLPPPPGPGDTDA